MFASVALLLLTSSSLLSVLGSPVQFRVDRSNHIFFPIEPSTNSLTLRLRTVGVTDIVLSSDMELIGPHYEITLGFQELGTTWSKISKGGADKLKVETPFILNGQDFTSFKILWDDAGHITVGRDQDSVPLILWKDTDVSESRPEIRYYGIRTRQLNNQLRHIGNPMYYCRGSYSHSRSLDTNVNEQSDWELEGTETVNFVEAFITNFLPSVGVSVSVSKPYESETTEPETVSLEFTTGTETESTTETETESATGTETESTTETETESATETETESATGTETESTTVTETETTPEPEPSPSEPTVIEITDESEIIDSKTETILDTSTSESLEAETTGFPQVSSTDPPKVDSSEITRSEPTSSGSTETPISYTEPNEDDVTRVITYDYLQDITRDSEKNVRDSQEVSYATYD